MNLRSGRLNLPNLLTLARVAVIPLLVLMGLILASTVFSLPIIDQVARGIGR